jgi:nicotinamide mononucleotide transporter
MELELNFAQWADTANTIITKSLYYIKLHWIELIATLFSLLYLYLEIKEKKSLWLVGILSSGLFCVVFFNSSFYADFGLNFYYVIISIYGWFNWRGKKNAVEHELPIRNINTKQIATLTSITIGSYLILLGILLYLPNYLDLASSAFPFMDALLVAASLTATWMLSQKIVEHWYVWIIVNFVSISMFGFKELYFTSVLYAIYFVGSIIGLQTWQSHLKNQTNTNA